MYSLQIDRAGTLSGHQNPIFTIENGPDPVTIFTGGNDEGVVQWNLETMAFERILYPVQFSVYALHVIANSTLLAIGTRDGKVHVIDTQTQQLVARLDHHQRPVFAIKSFADKPELVVSSEDGTVSIWNTDTFNLLYHLKVSDQTVRTIAISNDEQWVVFGTKAGEVMLYRSEEHTSELQSLMRISYAVFCLKKKQQEKQQ